MIKAVRKNAANLQAILTNAHSLTVRSKGTGGLEAEVVVADGRVWNAITDILTQNPKCEFTYKESDGWQGLSFGWRYTIRVNPNLVYSFWSFCHP